MAWISSTMTCSTPRRISRAWLVSRRYRLSGVVMRMSGGRRAISRRSCEGVSPVRLATVICGGVFAEALGGETDPRQRSAQVALDVVGQRLERRDVQHPDVVRGRLRGDRARVRGEAVERVQERGERLATARRGVDQGVITAGDRRPALRLGLGRGLETRLEPGPDRGRERREGIGDDRESHGSSSIRPDGRLDHPFYRGVRSGPAASRRRVRPPRSAAPPTPPLRGPSSTAAFAGSERPRYAAPARPPRSPAANVYSTSPWP